MIYYMPVREMYCHTTNIIYLFFLSSVASFSENKFQLHMDIQKENTALRANVCPNAKSVIPNAVDTMIFKPDLLQKPKSRTKIVVIRRLVYRKGIDFLAEVIPKVCSRHADVDFIIGSVKGSEQTMMDQKNHEVEPFQMLHIKLSKMYRWDDVASRFKKVYFQVTNEAVDNLPVEIVSWLQGYVAGAL